MMITERPYLWLLIQALQTIQKYWGGKPLADVVADGNYVKINVASHDNFQTQLVKLGVLMFLNRNVGFSWNPPTIKERHNGRPDYSDYQMQTVSLSVCIIRKADLHSNSKQLSLQWLITSTYPFKKHLYSKAHISIMHEQSSHLCCYNLVQSATFFQSVFIKYISYCRIAALYNV